MAKLNYLIKSEKKRSEIYYTVIIENKGYVRACRFAGHKPNESEIKEAIKDKAFMAYNEGTDCFLSGSRS